MHEDWPYAEKVRIFVSYPRSREDLRATFVDVVADEALRQFARVWTDEEIDPGAKWDQVLRAEVLDADIILLLMTPQFLESEYCTDVEGTAAREQSEMGRAMVFVVLLESCDYASKGFGSLPLLSDEGSPLRSSARAKQAVARVQLDLKYAAYECFERKNAAIERLTLHASTLLSEEHDEHGRTFTTKTGSVASLAAGVACGLAAGALCARVVGVDRWWALLLTIVAAGVLTGALAAVTRLIEVSIEQRSLIGLDLGFVGGWMVGGLIAALYGGLLVILVLLIESIPRAPAMLIIASLIGAYMFFGSYDFTRPKRLAVYHDLVRAGRRPRGGWRIETIDDELRRSDEEFIERLFGGAADRESRARPPDTDESDG